MRHAHVVVGMHVAVGGHTSKPENRREGFVIAGPNEFFYDFRNKRFLTAEEDAQARSSGRVSWIRQPGAKRFALAVYDKTTGEWEPALEEANRIWGTWADHLRDVNNTQALGFSATLRRIAEDLKTIAPDHAADCLKAADRMQELEAYESRPNKRRGSVYDDLSRGTVAEDWISDE